MTVWYELQSWDASERQWRRAGAHMSVEGAREDVHDLLGYSWRLVRHSGGTWRLVHSSAGLAPTEGIGVEAHLPALAHD